MRTPWGSTILSKSLSRTISEINPFYAEFQDGHQKWCGNNFWKKIPDDCNTLGIKNFVIILHCIRDKCAFVFYTEIQDGCQKLRENNFWTKLPDDSVDTQGLKNFVKIALSCTVYEILKILLLLRKI